MPTQIAEELRALADKAENPQLEEAARYLGSIVVQFPDLVNAPCGECGWTPDEVILGPHDDDDHAYHAGPEEDTTFFTEGFLYDLLGKEDARTVLSAVRNVLRAAGLSDDLVRELT